MDQAAGTAGCLTAHCIVTNARSSPAAHGSVRRAQKRGRQRMVDLEAGNLDGELFGGLAAVVGDDHGLDESIQLEVFGSLAGLLCDKGHGGIEALGVPADGV